MSVGLGPDGFSSPSCVPALTQGFPKTFPRALARARASRVRAQIKARSFCANAAYSFQPILCSIKQFAKHRPKRALLSRRPLLHDGHNASKSPMSGFEIDEVVSEFGVGLKDVGQLADASDNVTHRTSSMMPGLDELRLGGRIAEIVCDSSFGLCYGLVVIGRGNGDRRPHDLTILVVSEKAILVRRCALPVKFSPTPRVLL